MTFSSQPVKTSVARLDPRTSLLPSTVMTKPTIHTLVNSEMGKQKRRTAIALRRIADMYPGTARFEADAADAERDYEQHQHKQAVVDRD